MVTAARAAAEKSRPARFYVATGAGNLFAIETGDPGDDGWPI
jgi:hypothetical protein